MFREFRPAFIFLGKFLGLYIVGNLLYGLYIKAYNPVADPVTWAVTAQTSACLNILGSQISLIQDAFKPSIGMIENEESVISVFEGCNGLNVMIIFVAFVVAFGGPRKAMLWFIPVGLLVIHIVNLLRIGLLYYTAQYYAHYFYYVHKYFFTAILYFIIFALWALWVIRYNGKTRNRSSESPA